MSYLKVRSWHSIVKVDEAGWHTRCGRLVEEAAAPASDVIPLDEKSCETCLRLTVHDAEPRDEAGRDE